jgi:predicted dehydrogenase
MTTPGKVRWGIAGTANIARSAFLPALREAGGAAVAVAGRDGQRAAQFARDNGIERAVEGYHRLIEDPGVDALYIPLPNSLHAEWTIRALRAGRPVLCEKPLTGSVADTERVLGVARETGTLLWEAFVFPFHAQFRQILGLLGDGVIGELREIQSNFHFRLSRPDNIRLRRDLDGGALNDVGCYPVRLAQEVFGAEHTAAWATAEWGGDGVDVASWGILGYPDGRRLLLSCGMQRSYDTFTRLQGTSGQIHILNPFHPGREDWFEVRPAGREPQVYQAGGDEYSFTAAIRHIQAVLRGEQAPRQLAADTSPGTGRALHDLIESATARRT